MENHFYRLRFKPEVKLSSFASKTTVKLWTFFFKKNRDALPEDPEQEVGFPVPDSCDLLSSCLREEEEDEAGEASRKYSPLCFRKYRDQRDLSDCGFFHLGKALRGCKNIHL